MSRHGPSRSKFSSGPSGFKPKPIQQKQPSAGGVGRGALVPVSQPSMGGVGRGALVPVSQPSSGGVGRGTLVPRDNRPAAVMGNQGGTMFVPKGYTLRPVQPAKNYDVISFARAMNDDFGPRVKKLFDPETEAALDAQKTGIYIGWRCPDTKFDCQRINTKSKCFCGHLLKEHASYNGKSVNVPCKQSGCPCKAYAWIPSRPEDIGEFWFQRRRGFDVTQWRAKCRCKHTHEEHKATGYRECMIGGCKCGMFESNFLCAACDKHWEDHQTFFEDTDTRRRNGLPVGADYLPFAEIPSLRNMALTGVDDEDMSYMSVIQSPYAQPLPLNRPSDNNTPALGMGRQQMAIQPGQQSGPSGQFPALGGPPMGQFPPALGAPGGAPMGRYRALGAPGGTPMGQFQTCPGGASPMGPPQCPGGVCPIGPPPGAQGRGQGGRGYGGPSSSTGFRAVYD